ncbi:MAG: RNA 2',3'-cyclic phosphodiesterase [Ruminococcaceae bacterium]|nr:RNA 2',3'-cyclic phosphodiesterase [Oscillospiraceae bacterium]
MRLFVAVRFSAGFVRALTDCQRSVRLMAGEESGNRKPVNWTKPDNLHVTLAFLGERKDPESVIRALRSVSFEPFRIECGPFRKFGDALTVGIRDGGESVRLAKAVRSALDGAGISYDGKPPVPHATLARNFRLPLPDGISLAAPEGKETVSSFSLMKSEGGGPSLVYTELWNSARGDRR